MNRVLNHSKEGQIPVGGDRQGTCWCVKVTVSWIIKFKLGGKKVDWYRVQGTVMVSEKPIASSRWETILMFTPRDQTEMSYVWNFNDPYSRRKSLPQHLRQLCALEHGLRFLDDASALLQRRRHTGRTCGSRFGWPCCIILCTACPSWICCCCRISTGNFPSSSVPCGGSPITQEKTWHFEKRNIWIVRM